jgi:hypothetical protein
MLTIIPLSTKAFPPASPAGGNYLVLDGVDDYAVLDFKTHGIFFPKGTEEFTVEAWVYPTTPPAGNVYAMILSQQVEMRLASDNGEWEEIKKGIDWQTGDLFLLIRGHIMVKGVPATKGTVIALSPNQWHHIAYQSDGREEATIVNDFAKIRKWPIGWPLAHDLAHFEHPKDFTLGGFGKKIQIHDNFFRGPFAGYIDEVRISTVARYDISKNGFTPRDKFKKDHETLALWHFDEPGGTRRFSDASGHAHHLVGEGGASTGIPLAVEPHGKLTTTWGQLKQ